MSNLCGRKERHHSSLTSLHAQTAKASKWNDLYAFCTGFTKASRAQTSISLASSRESVEHQSVTSDMLHPLSAVNTCIVGVDKNQMFCSAAKWTQGKTFSNVVELN